jgi:hypothetical protein
MHQSRRVAGLRKCTCTLWTLLLSCIEGLKAEKLRTLNQLFGEHGIKLLPPFSCCFVNIFLMNTVVLFKKTWQLLTAVVYVHILPTLRCLCEHWTEAASCNLCIVNTSPKLVTSGLALQQTSLSLAYVARYAGNFSCVRSASHIDWLFDCLIDRWTC